MTTDARPLGVVWITKAMREAWIVHGHVLHLDAMKRQLNDLYWPYVGPVAMHQEGRIVTVCESLVIEESLGMYVFVLNSLFEMERMREKYSTRI